MAPELPHVHHHQPRMPSCPERRVAWSVKRLPGRALWEARDPRGHVVSRMVSARQPELVKFVHGQARTRGEWARINYRRGVYGE
jgi:hypothetical protein